MMREQPAGVRRVRRAAGATGKAVQYTIYYGPPAEGLEREVPIGYTEREAKGSLSLWKAFPGDGTWPTVHKVHTDAVEALIAKYRETGAVLTPNDPGAQAPLPPLRKKRRQITELADVPEGRKPQARTDQRLAPGSKKPRKSRAARGADAAEARVPEATAPAAEAEPVPTVPAATAPAGAESPGAGTPADPAASSGGDEWSAGYPEGKPPVPAAAFLEPSDDPFRDPLSADPLAPGFISR
jgi:hypothetical protein